MAETGGTGLGGLRGRGIQGGRYGRGGGLCEDGQNCTGVPADGEDRGGVGGDLGVKFVESEEHVLLTRITFSIHLLEPELRQFILILAFCVDVRTSAGVLVGLKL